MCSMSIDNNYVSLVLSESKCFYGLCLGFWVLLVSIVLTTVVWVKATSQLGMGVWEPRILSLG